VVGRIAFKSDAKRKEHNEKKNGNKLRGTSIVGYTLCAGSFEDENNSKGGFNVTENTRKERRERQPLRLGKTKPW